MDHTERRRRVLKHCLWMASMDPDYAKWAARYYEQESHGVLEGLEAKVLQAIQKRNNPKPENQDGI